MGQNGEKGLEMPRPTKKRSPRERTKRIYALQLHQIEPVAVQSTCRGTDSKLHQSLLRLLEPEYSQQAELRMQGDKLSGSARRVRRDVTEMPSTPPASRDFQEVFVPDSPEETASRKRTDLTELPSTPPVSRGVEGSFVPDSPEDTWALGEDPSRRPCKMPRTPPISTNVEELIVPDSPEETWASPQKLSRPLPVSTKFENLMVPDSLEESGANKNSSRRLVTARRSHLRDLHPELVDNRKKAGFRRPVLPSVGASNQSERHGFHKAAQSRQLTVSEAEKISQQPAHISGNRGLDKASQLSPTPSDRGSPRVTDVLRPLSKSSFRTPRGKPPAIPSTVLNKASLDLRDEERNNCAQAQGAVHRNEYLGETMPLYVQDTEDPAPLSPFSTIHEVSSVSSVAFQQPTALLLPNSVEEAGTSGRAGVRYGKDLHRDVTTPIRQTAGDPAPTTPFHTASEKPVSRSFRPLKKARALLLREELDSSEKTAEGTGTRHENIASRVVPSSEISTDTVDPESSPAGGSEKPVLLSSKEPKIAIEFAEKRLRGSEMCDEFAGGSSIAIGNSHKKAQSSKFSSSQDARSTRPLTASGDVQRSTFTSQNDAVLPTSLATGNGKAFVSSTDVQVSPVNASDATSSVTFFLPGCSRPASSATTALERVKELLRDEFEEVAVEAEISGTGHQGKLDIDAKPLQFSRTEDAATTNSTTVGMGEMDVQPPPSHVVDSAVPISCFVTGSGKSVAAVSSRSLDRAKMLLENQFEATETTAKAPRVGDREFPRYDEFVEPAQAGTGFRENLRRHGQTSKVTGIEYVQPSLMAEEKTHDASLCVSSAASDYAVPITSFVTGSGKSVAPVSSESLKRVQKLLGDQFQESETVPKGPRAGDQMAEINGEYQSLENCIELSETGCHIDVNQDVQTSVQTSKVINIEGTSPTISLRTGVKTLDPPTFVTSPAIEYAVPITSYVTGSGKPVAAVSAKALERVKKLLGDQFEEIETTAKVSRAGDQRPEFPACVLDPPMSVSTVNFNNVTGFLGTSAWNSVPSLASEKNSIGFAIDQEHDPASRISSGFGNQTPPFQDTSRENGKLESSSAFLLKRAEMLLGDRAVDVCNSGGVALDTLSTACGRPVSVTPIGIENTFFRDDRRGSNDHPPLPKDTNHSIRIPVSTSDRNVQRNSKFDATLLSTRNDECLPAKLSRELAMSVPVKASEKAKAALEADGKENCGDSERIAYLKSRRDELRYSEFTTNTTRKPLSEIQAGFSILQPSDRGKRLSPANGKMGAICSSQCKEGNEICEGKSSQIRSGRTVAISKETLLAAKVRLGADVRSGNGWEAPEETDYSVGKSSFTTGSGRTVTVSREAMEKASTIIADGMTTASLREPAGRLSNELAITNDSGSASIFCTASGRTVAISSEAMSRARDLLAAKGTPHSPSHDRELNVQRGLSKDNCLAQKEKTSCSVTTSRVETAWAVTPHPDQLCRDDELGQPCLVTNKSTQLKFQSSDCGPSRPILPSTVGDNESRNVRFFKPPRIRDRREPDNTITSEGKRLTVKASASSGGIQRSSSNLSFEIPAYHQLQPTRLAYLHARVGPGGRKLRAYVGGPPASEECSLSIEVRPMTADAAEQYRIQHVTPDGRCESVGSTEIWHSILGQGADILYASKEWVANHYKWIIWKLVSLERKHAQKAARKPVNLDTVLNELKYRYDTELSGFRSAIRRITEGDSSASRAMVLCVSAVRDKDNKESSLGHNSKLPSSDAAEIEVTDGWYRLRAVLDKPLTELLRDGKLKVGQKIQVCGATLCCCSDPRSPLEAFQDSFLSLHMNGTYRAQQDRRLGFCRGSCLPLAFRIIKPDGGIVHKTYVGVTRVYPILFKETTAEGVSIIRTARAEEMASNQFEQRRTKAVEETIVKLQTSCNTALSPDEKDEGFRLFDAIERAAEPDILLAAMTPTQLKAFAAYQAKRETSRQAATEDAVKEALENAHLDKRTVKRFLKVRVAGLRKKSHSNAEVDQQTKEGTITIWDISDDQNIVEGSVYCVSGLRPGAWGSSGNKDHLQLQSYRSTSWTRVPEALYDNLYSFPFTRRAPTRLSELDEKCVNREFDVAVTVLQVGEPLQIGSHQNQWVFVTDGSTALNSPGDTWVEIQILAIKVNLPSLAFAPVEPSLVGSTVGFCNLIQQPKDHIAHLWVAEASELSFYSSKFTSLPMKHLRAEADRVSKWAASSRWETDSLRHLVQGLLWEGSQESIGRRSA